MPEYIIKFHYTTEVHCNGSEKTSEKTTACLHCVQGGGGGGGGRGTILRERLFWIVPSQTRSISDPFIFLK